MKIQLHTLIPITTCEIIKEWPNSLPLGTKFELKRVYKDNNLSATYTEVFVPQKWSLGDVMEKDLFENCSFIISKDEVYKRTDHFKITNSFDSLIEKPNFDILRFVDTKESVEYRKTDDDSYEPNANIDFTCGLNYCIEHFDIEEVLRLSDCRIFMIGNFVKNKNKDTSRAAIHKIESFSIKRKQKNRTEFYGPNTIWVKYEGDSGGHWLDELEFVDVILETFDNYKLTKGDYVYRLIMGSLGNINVIFKEYISSKDFKQHKDSLYFGDETSAKIYASLNSVKYSEQDILNACVDELTPTQKIELGLDCFKRVIDLSKLTK